MKNLYQQDSGAVRHEFNMGMSGSGKTTYIQSRIAQQVKRGGGLTAVDAKLDSDFLNWLYAICKTYNRLHHLRVINIDDASKSHTYNCLLTGDAEAVASRFANVVNVGGNVSAEHFKDMAIQALRPTIDCIKQSNMAYNALDLYVLMTNPTAMNWLLSNCPESEAKQNYQIHLESYKDTNAKGEREINMTRMRSQIQGVAAKLYPYGTGHLGKIMGSYSPEFSLLDGIDNNLITYVMLPTMDKSESALPFAKLFLSDLVSTVALLYKRPKYTLPRVPHEFYGDEFGSWAISHFEEAFEKFRGANVALSVSFQTAANLLTLGEDFAYKIIGNCNTRNFMQLGDPQSCEMAAKIVGQILKEFKSTSTGKSVGQGNKNLDWQVFHNVSQSASTSESSAERYDYILRPEDFMKLNVGEMYSFSLAAKRSFKIKVPMYAPAEDDVFELIRYQTPQKPGLELAKRFNVEFAEE